MMAKQHLPIDSGLEQELAPYRQWITGRVLNAGCGKRYVDLGADTLRIDINPAFAVAVDTIADLHHLPFAANTFNAVVSIAVLEHTRYAWEVAREFYRVLQPGGAAVVAIPFMQPRHGAPHDYVRFTDTGIRALMEWAGFEVVQVQGVHTLGYTLEWFMREILRDNTMLRRALYPLRQTLFPRLRDGRLLTQQVENLRSAYYVVARKPQDDAT
jgi:SAM-dependent methyltransferase